ncbi:hypothetical protein Poli38472_001924 [Pythium oligandrum]|uniref:Ankyrin repeat protein n=1 Tax=Pythium oligandrum TaxID=41045 RepID=A0A8K1CVM1_PYTOL|nr:hypothetical protein Poli38472_001924 [Pythium oligandrum]|eukprot:TMW69768.1 hypothetical protein Poli38472_001924 [Pythium oligandrum]
MTLQSTEKHAFITAAPEGRLDDVKELLNGGVDLFVTTPLDGQTALYAAAAGHADVVRFLLSKGVDGGHIEALNCETQRAVDLVLSSRHVDVLKAFTEFGDLGTALVETSAAGDVQGVELLLQLGLDANAVNWDSALCRAAQGGHEAVAKALLEHGPGVNLKSGRLLLNHGADVNVPGQWQWTSLHQAAQGGHVDVVDALLAGGADVNAVSQMGTTALYEASRIGHVATVKVLLDRGATVHPLNSQNPMNAAAFCGSVEVLELLHTRGFLLNATSADMTTPLHEASENGHVVAVEWLLARGANADAVDSNGKNPLHFAACKGHGDVAELLLAHGIQVDARDTCGGWTALHEVCVARPEADEVVLQLLNYGFNASLPDMYSHTPLLLACTVGNGKIATMLLDRVTDIDVVSQNGTTALFYACGAKNLIDVVRSLLGRGADPLCVSAREQTLLHTACEHGNAEVVQLLLDRGINVNALDRINKTALQYAVSKGSADAVKLLLQHGADTQLVDNINYTAFRYACGFGYVDVVNEFLKYEPYSEEKEEYFNGALSEACTSSRLEVAELLIEHGVKASHAALQSASRSGQVELVQLLLAHNVDPNESPDSPLHYAALSGEHEVVKLLLVNGANVHARDSHNYTALHSACRWDSQKAAAVLLEYGVDIDAVDKDGSTALHIAASNGNVSCVELLLKHGADSSIADVSGWTALHHACRRIRPAVVRVLVSNGADVATKNPDGEIPLHIAAASHGHAGNTPLDCCLQTGSYESYPDMTYKVAYELVKHGATYEESSDNCQSMGEDSRDQFSALELVVQCWVAERQENKPFTAVPVDVIIKGRAATEMYLEKLRTADAE